MIDTPHAVTPTDRRNQPDSRVRARLRCPACGGEGLQQLPSGIWIACCNGELRDVAEQRRASGWVVLGLVLVIAGIVAARLAGVL